MIKRLSGRIAGTIRRGAVGALALGICSAAMIGCSAPGNKKSAPVQENSGINGESVRTVAAAKYPEQPVYKSDEERWEAERDRYVPEAFVNAYEAFTCETAAEFLRDEAVNVTYSPMSLYFALAAAAEGAGGETKRELLNLLGYSRAESLPDDLKTAYEALYHVADVNDGENKLVSLEEYDPSARYQLQICNSVWADQSVRLKDSFADHVSKYFYSDVYSADFQKEETELAMNSWVEQRTNGLIRPEITLDQETLLSIMNTIYFYDEWVNRFDSERTAPDVFHMADGSDVTCDFMNMEMDSHGFIKGENYISSSLSLKNGSMTFFLPDEGTDVRELIESPKKLQELMSGGADSYMGQVTWKVPKFSVGSKLQLREALTKLGLTHMFEDADFSAMTETPVFVSNVIQEAHVAVNEEGVEAAAFTQIDYAGAALPNGTAEMILDRPFLYVIRNKGQVLFLGICGNPLD